MERPSSYVKDAELARAAWDRRFGSQRGMRKALAAQHGVGESFVGLMLNGYTAINPVWKQRFASFLGVKVTEIWPDADPLGAIAEFLPPHVAELMHAGLEADEALVRAATLLLRGKQ